MSTNKKNPAYDKQYFEEQEAKTPEEIKEAKKIVGVKTENILFDIYAESGDPKLVKHAYYKLKGKNVLKKSKTTEVIKTNSHKVSPDNRAVKAIKEPDRVINTQNIAKQKSQKISADIVLSSIHPKETNETPKIKGRILKIETDSTWVKEVKDGVSTITNGKGVWEFTEGEFEGEQIFTQEAAVREAKNNNMRVPPHNELLKIIQSIISNIDPDNRGQDYKIKPSIKDILKVKLAGYRDPGGSFYGQGGYGYLWSSTDGCCIMFDKTQIYPRGKGGPSCAFSVFCVEN